MPNRGVAAAVTVTSLLILSVAASLVLGSHAVAAQDYSLSLSPATGRPGITTQAGGSIFSGCSPDSVAPKPVTVTWRGPTSHQSTLRLAQGTTGVQLTVPAGATQGRYEVSLTCTVGDDARPIPRSASTTFDVLGPGPGPSLRLSPKSVGPEGDVTASGTNFPAGCSRPGATTLQFDGARIGIDSSPTTGPTKTLDVVFSVPTSATPGSHQVVLTCASARATGSLDVLSGSEPPATDTTTAIDPPSDNPVVQVVDERIITPVRNDFARLETPAPPNRRTAFARSIPLPSQVPWAGPAILLSAVVFGFLFWAMGFPSEPFNKTLEENRDRIRRWFSRRTDARPVFPGGWGSFAVFTILAAALLSLVEQDGTFDPAKTLTLALGFLIAVPVTTIAYAGPAEARARKMAPDRAQLRFMPAALVFAAVCVALSRWADFQPGYVYGLFAFFAPVAASIRARVDGRGILLGSVSLLAVSIAAWLLWPPVAAAAAGPDPRYVTLVLDAALAAIFCLGVQTLVFGLIPITFMDGKKLRSWSSWAWAGVWGCALLLLVHVMFVKFLVEVDSLAAAIKASLLFLVFFALSAGFWLVFKARHIPRPSRVATAVLVLLVATPATVAIALTLREKPAPPPPPVTATVNETANVRAGPSRDTKRVGTLSTGTLVTLQCVAEAGHGPFHRLGDPHPGNFVANSLLDFPDTRRPPPC